ncbi:hypothetical protein ACT7DG_08750 [Bacillus cereus]
MIEKKLGCTFPPQYREFVKKVWFRRYLWS